MDDIKLPENISTSHKGIILQCAIVTFNKESWSGSEDGSLKLTIVSNKKVKPRGTYQVARRLGLQHNLLVGGRLVTKPVVEKSVLLLRVAQIDGLGLALAAHHQLQIRHFFHTCDAAGHQVRGSSQPALKQYFSASFNDKG